MSRTSFWMLMSGHSLLHSFKPIKSNEEAGGGPIVLSERHFKGCPVRRID
jgi:hypothetical protein